MMSNQTESLTSCPSCGIAFPSGARFCPSCGTPIALGFAHAATLDGGLSPLADPLIGKVIAERYRILAMLGRGGMGVVYRVEHVHIGKLMAMKLLSGELAGDQQVLSRFEREAKAVSKLSHPNTVQIFDFGESASIAYLVMEYLPGRDLAAVIEQDGPLDFKRVARIGAQIAGSVDEAHQRGIIHRDIKPENVMLLDTLEQRDFVKVLDFGIAKLRDVDENVAATQRGHLIGTPFYMAPEQIRGEAIDHRVDVYALGALMYTALTGETPFVADTPMEVLGKHLMEPLEPASRRAPMRGIPLIADRILRRALEKDPNDRYPTMAAMREELTRYLAAEGLDAPRTAPARLGADTLATRLDIQGYEGRIARSGMGWGLKLLLLALLIALGVGAYFVLAPRFFARPRSAEVEPNDTTDRATVLTPGVPLRAQIGKRVAKTQGDADVFRIDVTDDDARVADLRVSPLPNIDLVLELFEGGSSLPLLVVDGGKVGEGERIPNIGLRSDRYYVRVREATSAGVPTENVSDHYTIQLTLGAAPPGREHELNDRFELAGKLVPAQPIDGVIGWAGDRDVYCSAPGMGPLTVELRGVPALDLVLAYLDRRTDTGQRVDRGGLGEGERLVLPAAKATREACFTVTAREREGAQLAHPDQAYRIELH